MKRPSNKSPVPEPSVLPVMTLGKAPHGRTPLENLLMKALGTADVSRLESFLSRLRGKAVILERRDYEGMRREIRRLAGNP